MAAIVKKRTAKQPLMVARLARELRLVATWQTKLAKVLEEASQPCEDVGSQSAPHRIAGMPGFPGGVGPGPGATKCAMLAYRVAHEAYACDLAVVAETLGIWTKSVAQELTKFPRGTKVPLKKATAGLKTRARATRPTARKPGWK
jgi:hypothetical protein